MKTEEKLGSDLTMGAEKFVFLVAPCMVEYSNPYIKHY